MAELPPLDVLVGGEGVTRGVVPRLGDDGLRIGGRTVPYDEIFWVSRRVGLLMIFTAGGALAVKGDRGALERLAHGLEERLGRASGRGRLPPELTAEVVVFTAGVAAVGRTGGRRTSGLRVAVFTRRGVHLLGGRETRRVRWPLDEARTVDAEGAPGPALLLRRGDDVLRLLYLFPEEIRTALRLARSDPGEVEPIPEPDPRTGSAGDRPDPSRDGGEAGEGATGGGPVESDDSSRNAPEEGTEAEGEAGGAVRGEEDPRPSGPEGADDGEPGSMEMFARGEVAPPVRSELPELRLSVAVLQEAAEGAADGISSNAGETAGLPSHFLATHLVELGEIALGPMLLRKSAAASAGSLQRAVEAMDAADLREDTRAAVENAARRLAEVYRARLEELVEEKRAPPRVEEEHGLEVEELEEIRLRMQAPVDRMVPLLRSLEEAGVRLREQLRDLEEGPPDAGEEAVEEAREEWNRCLRRVDRAFEEAWEEMVGEAAEAWRSRLLPSLAEVGAMRRRRLPEWATLALLAAATLLLAGAAMILLVW